MHCFSLIVQLRIITTDVTNRKCAIFKHPVDYKKMPENMKCWLSSNVAFCSLSCSLSLLNLLAGWTMSCQHDVTLHT